MTRFQKILAGSILSVMAGLGAAAGVQDRSGVPAAAATLPQHAATVMSTAPRLATPARPVSLLAPKAITSDNSYDVLMRRSIFSRDHKARGYQGDGLIIRKASAESKLIFRGAMKEGTRFIASIEDTDARKALWFHDGEKLSEGTLIRQITLDHLIVEKNGSRKRVDLGQSMEGTPVSLAESAPTLTSSDAPPAATASSAETPLGKSVEEMMRRRRVQDLERSSLSE